MDVNYPEAYQDFPAGAREVAELEVVAGSIVTATVHVHSVAGAPTSASLAVKWQVAPLTVSGPDSIASHTSGVLRAWQDVVASDPDLGWTVLQGDWPATIASQSLTVPKSTARQLYVPPLCQFVRLIVTPAFTGGTAQSFKCTVAYAVTFPR